ncbi:protein FAR1-RELATED SEQUENCE 5-like [Bidens hawaiensis]|uniref:protein FAR1-RELATED SEQUENCE 5-like n=1 Tax=Bidens hawaiensis TaxID=980011 RepID=UPI004048FC27
MYLRCNKAGKPQGKRKFDTLCESSLKMRQCTFSVIDCLASISLQVCEETSVYNVIKFCGNHNHPLVEEYNRGLTKTSRKLTFSTQQFSHQMSLNKIGPTIAHRLQVSMKGGHHNVNGTATDFKNWYNSMRIHIGNRDSQLVLDRLKDHCESLPDFYFHFVVEKGKLKSVFWVDEILKISYQAFGDVIAFDATYKTNK